MTAYSMKTPYIRFDVAPTKRGTEDAVVTFVATDKEKKTSYFDLDPVEARSHAQHLLAVAEEVERIRKREAT